jgi:hypothetical protein
MTPSATAMRPIASEPVVPEQSDGDWLRDRTVVHKVVATLDVAHPALSDLLDQLARSHGRLQSLDVRPLGQGFEVVLRAGRLTPEAARRLVDRFAVTPGVAAASLEHMLIR